MAKPTANPRDPRRPEQPGGSAHAGLWAAAIVLLIAGGVIWYFIIQAKMRTQGQLESLPPAPADAPLVAPAPPVSVAATAPADEPDPASLLEVTATAIGPQTLKIRIRNGSLRGLRSAHVLFFAPSDLKHPFAEINVEHIGPRRAVESEMEVNGLSTLVPVGQSATAKIDASDFTAR